MDTLVYVPIADLKTIRDLISQKIEHYEAQFELAQAQEQLAQYKAAGFPTGKLCVYCGKAMFDSTEAEATRIHDLPEDQAVAHNHCHELKMLREELGKNGPHIVQASTDPTPEPAPVPPPEPAPETPVEEPKEDDRASA